MWAIPTCCNSLDENSSCRVKNNPDILSDTHSPQKNGIYFASNQIRKMANHSSILAWRIPWTGEPGGLQSMGSQGVRHDWATNTTTKVIQCFSNESTESHQLWEDHIFQAPDWNKSATGGQKKHNKQIKYLNSRWSRKIWDVTKSGEGSRENAQQKCGQRWKIRNGRRSRGRRGMGSMTWSRQHEVCAVGVSLGLVRQHWLLPTSLHCWEPKLRFPGVSHFTVLFGTKRRSPSENPHASILGQGFPGCSGGKESACKCRRHQLNPWVGKIPWRREWQPTRVCLSGQFCRQRSLGGYSPWGCKSWTRLSN